MKKAVRAPVRTAQSLLVISHTALQKKERQWEGFFQLVRHDVCGPPEMPVYVYELQKKR